jgi:hypothetical protein
MHQRIFLKNNRFQQFGDYHLRIGNPAFRIYRINDLPHRMGYDATQDRWMMLLLLLGPISVIAFSFFVLS